MERKPPQAAKGPRTEAATETLPFPKRPPPGRSLLSKPAILHHLKAGDIVVDPLDESCIGSDGIDVRLGANLWEQVPPEPNAGPLNPFDREQVLAHWRLVKPDRAGDYMEREKRKLVSIDRDDLIFIPKPRQLHLAHTEEFAGGYVCIATSVHARSSSGRSGITVCSCSDKVGVNYVNRLTLELRADLLRPEILVVGMRIAALSFYLVDPVEPKDGYRGKYITAGGLAEVKRRWDSRDMLPRFDSDHETKDGFPRPHDLRLVR